MFSTTINPYFNRFQLKAFAVLLLGLIIFPAANISAEGLTQTVQVVAIIEPELSLTVTPEIGSRLDFGTIHSSITEERLSDSLKLNVRVDSNLGYPYHVTQQLIQPIQSAEGNALPSGHLIATALDHTLPVSTEPTTLLTSDSFGRSSSQTIAYHLRVPPKQSAGTYRGTLMMTVTVQ